MTNRLLGLLIGLALLAAGVVVVVETALAAVGRPGWLVDRAAWADTTRQLRWDDPNLVTAAVILALLGLALLALQLWPVRPRFLPVAPHGPNRRDAIEGRGLQALLGRAASNDQDGVDADVVVRTRKAKVEVRTPSDAEPRVVRGRVEEQVKACLHSLSLEQGVAPRIRARRSKERVR